MEDEFPPQYAIHHSTFAIGPELNMLRSIWVKKCWGLFSGQAKLDYPAFPDSAYSYSLNNGQLTAVKIGFFETSEGRKVFSTYLAALQQVVEKYHPPLDAILLESLLGWEMSISVADKTASQGYRDIECVESTDNVIESFENTLAALRRPHKDKTPFVLNNDNEESDIYDQYLYCGEYMAIEGDVVNIHFYDFNDENFEQLHKVALDKTDFYNALLRAHTQLKKYLEDICKVLGLNFNDAKILVKKQ
ncbi:MAG TPA: hypothetical protein PL131_01985 [Methylotenera sp.]|nr:hypothetical protein [Methylotenera sp.]HPH04616.1 hypothetical protein [Methylotenera sp.]HPN01611.1 hypothetical protein [Methylotenera sp.]